MSDERALAWTHLLPRDVAYLPVGGSEWWQEALRTRSCPGGEPVPVLWGPRTSEGLELSAAAGVVAINPSRGVVNEIQSAQFPFVDRFAVLPALQEARLFVPLTSRSIAATALQLYMPYRLPARAMHGAVCLAARMGIHIWQRNILLVARRVSSPLEKVLAEALPNQPYAVAISAGTPGAYRKITMQVMARESGRPLAYIRLATTPLARAMLRNEGEWLVRLRSDSRLAPHCPIKLAEWDDGSQLALVTSSGPPRRGPQEFGQDHLEFLQLLTNSSRVFGIFKESPFLRHSREVLRGLEGKFPTEKISLVDALLDRLEGFLGDRSLPFVIAHRDFVPWNTRRFPDGRLFVFDWEFARPDWLPLTDMFHFYVQPSVLSGRVQGSLWGRFRRVWIKNAAQLGISEAMVLPLFAAYLADTALFYMSARAQYPMTGDDRVWTQLLIQASQLLPLLENGD